MTQRFSVFGFGVRLGAGFTVGTVAGIGMLCAAGYLAMKLSPDKKEEKEEESTDDSKSAN